MDMSLHCKSPLTYALPPPTQEKSPKIYRERHTANIFIPRALCGKVTVRRGLEIGGRSQQLIWRV